MTLSRRGRAIFRPSPRDALATSNAADKFHAAMSGKEPMAQTAIAEKRIVVNRSEKEELEGAVMQEVAEVILLCPNVILAWRQNGGAAPAADGVFRIWYYRWLKRPTKMLLPDFMCVLRDGRLGVIECKRRDWHYTGTDREVAQKAFINRIIATGGRGAFVTSAAQALALLK